MKKITIALSLILTTSAFTQDQTLQEQLDARSAEAAAKFPKAVRQLHQDGIDSVGESGIYGNVKKVGDDAPDFTLKNALGVNVQLSNLLEDGPVVLIWYRGGWCPYCNIALRAMQNKLPDIRKHGAQLVALTPELPDFSVATTKSNGLAFQVLTDLQNKVAREYGGVFTMADGVAKAMRERHSTNKRNADESNELPLALTYVIGQNGTITYAFADADYRKRAEPSRIVDALEALKNGPTPEHLLLQFWENTWNPPYDIDLIDRLMTEDFTITSSGKDTVGREAFKSWVKGFQSKIEGLRVENQDIFTSTADDRVTSRWIAKGRNNGLFGTEPDQRPIEFTGIAIWKVRDGKLAHNWVERSAYELYQSLKDKGE